MSPETLCSACGLPIEDGRVEVRYEGGDPIGTYHVTCTTVEVMEEE